MKYINPKYDLKPVTRFSPSYWIEHMHTIIMMEHNGFLFNPGEQKITSAEAWDLARDEIERIRNEYSRQNN